MFNTALQSVKKHFHKPFVRQINLPSIGLFQVEYVPENISYVRIVQTPENNVLVQGNCYDKSRNKVALIHWLKRIAKKHLTEQLNYISEKTNLPFNKVTIRAQKTRWGSCSEDKNINLNYRLIFLPEPLLHHVLIHELCHTVHLNHSRNFWQLVASFDPHYKKHNTLLRAADNFIPSWTF